MKHKLLRSAIIVMTINMLIKSLGFLREVVLASVYGAGMVTDAFVISFTIPSMVLGFMCGSMGAVYIPQYQKINGDKSYFTSNILNLFVVIGLIFSLVFTFIPQALVYLFASQLEPDTFTLASALVKIMIWAAIPILVAEIYRSYLQLHDAFFQAIIANSLINISVIICIVISSASQIYSFLAIGSVVGNLLCLCCLFLFSRKHDLKYRFYLDLKDSNLKEMVYLLGPVFLSSAIGELNQMIDRNFASSLVSGTVSSLNYANKANGLFTALIGSTIVTVLFPRMSELAAGGDYRSLKRYLVGCVTKLIPVLLPIMIGLIVLARPMVRILFERGAFTPEDTQRTAECLQMYALCFVVNNINPLFAKAFVSLRDTKTPAIVTAISIGINIILNILFISPMQHRGLALATSIAAITTAVLLYIRLRKKLGSLGFASDRTELLKIILSSVIMGAVVLIGYWTLPVMKGGYFQCVVYTVCLVMMGVIVCFLLHVYFRTEFLSNIVTYIHEQIPFKGNKNNGKG